MKLFLAIWLIISIIAASIAFAPHPLPTKDILILNIDGQIDSTLSSNFMRYFQNHPQPPDFLIIQITSPGGWSNNVELIGNALKSFEKVGTMVIFIPIGQCTSGCFWLSSYANVVIVGSNPTLYGFGHDIKNSTIQVNGFGNFNAIPPFYLAINAITANREYDYEISIVTLQANEKLGSP